MRELAKAIYANPKYTRVYQWSKLLTITGGSQAVIQAIGLITGILIIRMLPTQEYALYTLSNTMLGTMSLLADGGISAGVMAQAGRVWQDPQKLGSVISTGLELRRKFAVVSLIIAVPFLVYLLRNHDASWTFSILIVLALIPAFFASLSDSLLEIAPKLHQDITKLQKNQLAASGGRLLMIGSLIIFPWTFVAIIGNGIPRIWANIKLRNFSAAYADLGQKADIQVRKEILKTVKRMLPGVIYYCLSGQLTIWLISLFGSTASVAQIGALGRPAMALTVFNILLATLVIPRFSRLPLHKNLLFKRYCQIQAILVLLAVFIIAFTFLFSSQILWLLGKNYSDLNFELILTIIGGCVSLIAGASFSLNISRGWTMNPIISVPISIAAIIAGILLLNISTLQGVLLFNIFLSVVEVIKFSCYSIIKILNLKST